MGKGLKQPQMRRIEWIGTALVRHTVVWGLCLALTIPAAVMAAEGQQVRARSVDRPFFDDAEWSATAGLQYRYFPHEPLRAEPLEHHNLSAALEPAAYLGWDDGAQAFNLGLFGRLDQHDDARSHSDIREAFYLYAGDSFEFRAGVRKLFWGVVESVSRVDVINQSDFVEDIGGEDKLGQPMLDIAWFVPAGTLEFLVMPYFRERTFPSEEGRPNTIIQIDSASARYESRQRRQHVDLAARYAGSLGGVDFGLSVFRGTDRDPRFLFAFDACSAQLNPVAPLLGTPLPPVTVDCQGQGGPLLPLLDRAVESVDVAIENPSLIPVYDQIERAGLELQYLIGDLFLKLEAARERSDFEDYTALTVGLEYSFAGVWGSGWDVIAASEYLYDSRDQLSEALVRAADDIGRTGRARFASIESANALRDGLRPGSAAAFGNDVFLGMRVAFNDLRGSNLTTGMIVDADSGAIVGSASFSRRLTQATRASAALRIFADIPPSDPIYSFRKDDYLQLEIERFF